MQSNTPLNELLMQFVRNRDEFSLESYEIITSPTNVKKCYNFLLDMKRDIESQFIAHKSRKQANYVICEQAKADGTLATIWVDVEADESGRRQKEEQSLPPDIAYATFMAQENHWKVKILRFLALIESALADVKTHLHPYEPSALAHLVEIVQKHELADPDEPTGKPDEELYQALHELDS